MLRLWPLHGMRREVQACEEHHRAAVAYSKATRALNGSTASDPEHQRLLNLVNEARTKSKEARLVLERHVASHGC